MMASVQFIDQNRATKIKQKGRQQLQSIPIDVINKVLLSYSSIHSRNISSIHLYSSYTAFTIR